ncbi:tetratricopeptide repeat protein [Primorskyibacter sp. S87]|uniref:tetratricopeptide repeat protein n=1 Tax=Primorskyibacter sp. S87 TaxID=3415126 RepID=UPI003C7BD13D
MPDKPISDREKRGALQAVCESELFGHLERLQGFLAYVVEEELAGRGDTTRGKTIAQDVYGRSPDDGSDPENVVRVDARRLRQMLDHYYESVGAEDPVRLFMDVGGYRPRFERVVPQTGAPPSGKLLTIGLPVLTFAVGTAIGIAVSSTNIQSGLPPVATGPDRSKVLERQTIREKSPASLQAVNLAEQARMMIFPIFDAPRQQLVAEVFKRVIELDPDYFGGYAGAAQTTATLAIVTPPGEIRQSYLSEASRMAGEAIRREPSDPWAQSASAWAKFANREFDEALRLSGRAAELAPEDGDILDIHGSISLFSGEFEQAAEASQLAIGKGAGSQRSANRNIFAASSYHLGNYAESLKAFQEAADFGDPISAPSFAYQAAGLQALGRESEAKEKLAELQRAWPEADVEGMLSGIFRDPGHVEALMHRLREIGRPPE